MDETITWIACAERLPDDLIAVLIATRGATEPVWIGWLDGGAWCDTDGGECDVVAWAEIPQGPAAVPAKEE